MLYWSDFQVAKAIHKEHEQFAQQHWLLKQALATSDEAHAPSPYLDRWLHSLKRVFLIFQHDQQVDCCQA